MRNDRPNTEAMPIKRVLVLALCFAFCAHVSSLPAAGESRILEGEDATAGQYPWVVSVRKGNAHICTGSIISENKILTAGQCVSRIGTTPVATSEITLRVGSINQFAGGSIVGVSSIVIHPSYGNFLHDLAILTTETPLKFGEKIQKIELAAKIEEESENNELENETPVHVQGWGELLSGASSFKLQSTVLKVLSGPWCELEAGFGYDSVICLQHAEKQGVCRGDQGAGVVSEDKKLVGVVSFFFGNCGSKYPDIASKVTNYLDWINANL